MKRGKLTLSLRVGELEYNVLFKNTDIVLAAAKLHTVYAMVLL
jgi:hypothetical protein